MGGRGARALHMVIEIAPEGVQALIFTVSREGMPRVVRKIALETGSAAAGIGMEAHGSEEMRRTAGLLHDLLLRVVRQFGVLPRVVIGIGTFHEMITFQEIAVRIDRPQKHYSGRMLEEYLRGAAESRGEGGNAWRVFPVRIIANGYETDAKILSRGDAAGVKELVFPSVVMNLPEELSASFEGVTSMWGGIAVEFVPLQILLLDAFMKNGSLGDALMILLDRTHTLLLLFRDQKLLSFASFAHGSDEMVRHAAKNQELSFKDGRARVREYTQGFEMPGGKIRLGQALEEAARVWKKYLLDALDGLYHLGPLPADVILFGEGGRIPEVRRALSAEDWLGHYSFAATPHVRLLQGQALFQGDSLAGALGGPEDVPLAALMGYSLHKRSLFI